ncbi:MAG TPA: DinB family protein [Gemmatimonadaceae bacterium]|nr:DinB family protein [Gemmatimonadaceae bacterium]
MPDDKALREQIAKTLDWEESHASFDSAVKGLAPALRGRVPPGLPYSPWQLLEHIRRTQADILEFCVAKKYKEKEWPKDYWPEGTEPPSAKAWDESIKAVKRDQKALAALALDSKTDLTARVPNGTGQTYLREVLLTADHTAYHVGELIVVRRLLGAWPSG